MNEQRLVDEERVEIAHMHLEVFQMLYEEHEYAEWGKMIFSMASTKVSGQP